MKTERISAAGSGLLSSRTRCGLGAHHGFSPGGSTSLYAIKASKHSCFLARFVACLLVFYGISAFAQADTAEPPLPSASPWQTYNRGLLVGLAFLNRRYTEFDSEGITPDGIFNTEKGTLAGGAARLRWQGSLALAGKREVHIQGEYRAYTGDTKYQGYLQPGLTPYSSTTYNDLYDFRVRLGFPVVQTESTQWIPFLEYRYQYWLRDLVQYQETYQHAAGVIGVLGQWRVSPTWVLEGEIGGGSTLYATIDVPSVGFNEKLPNRGLWTMGASASYRINNRWRAVASTQFDQIRYGQSRVSNGFYEPASRTRQNSTLLAIEYHQ